MGLDAVLGGAGGAVLGVASPLWKATIGSKADGLLSDFGARMKFLRDNPDPVQALNKELTDWGGGTVRPLCMVLKG